jgi:hypothetical protein
MFITVDDPVEPVPEDINEILGDTRIKPTEPHYYYMKLSDNIGEWSITLPASKNKEVDDVLEYKVVGNRFKVTWTDMRSGQFIIHNGDYEKTIIVESLF